MNSLEKLGFELVKDEIVCGEREIAYMRTDYKITIAFKSLFDGEPFIQIIYGGNLLYDDEMLKINTAINEYWNENKDKFKRGA